MTRIRKIKKYINSDNKNYSTSMKKKKSNNIKKKIYIKGFDKSYHYKRKQEYYTLPVLSSSPYRRLT